MRARATTAGVLFVLTLSVIIGCAKYKVTHELEIPIDRTSACEIGDIKDLLPPDVEPEDRPTADDLDRLAHEVRTQLEQQGIFDVVGVGPAPAVRYVSSSDSDSAMPN
jgi:hypothetical protein